jgi:aryl-alcohol dehydrogenase-like predicted oxidoreductase
MRNRTLGRHGFEVSEVGLGCWQFGGDFGPITDDTALEIMRVAVDSGITFFDTANVYGAGRSESLIGRFRQSVQVPLRIATKFGRGDVYPDGYSERALRSAIEESCQRLGVDRLDLLQLHCVPSDVLAAGEIFDWLRSAQRDGVIEYFGASVESDDQAMLCLRQEGLQSLQIIFNVFRQKPLESLLPLAAQRGVGIIARLPLASGLLTGKFTEETEFAAEDHRRFNRDGQHFNVGETFAGLPFDVGVRLAEAIKPQVPAGMTMAQMSQRWLLDHEAVSTIITGASTPTHAAANASVSDLERLPSEVHQALAIHYHQQVLQHIRGPY